jgi:hypothetical protein
MEALAGIVDQDIDPTETHHGRVDEPPDLFGISKVRLDGESVRQLAGQLGDAVEASRGQDDLGAASGGKAGGRRADPGGCPGHDDDGAVELHQAHLQAMAIRPATEHPETDAFSLVEVQRIVAGGAVRAVLQATRSRRPPVGAISFTDA